MKIQEALKKISNFLKVKEMAFFVLEKDSINVELEKSELEAIRILMSRFEELDGKQNLATKEMFEKEHISKDKLRKRYEEVMTRYNQQVNEVYKTPGIAFTTFQRLVGEKNLLETLLKEE